MNPHEASHRVIPENEGAWDEDGSIQAHNSSGPNRAKRLAVLRRIARDARVNAKGYTLSFDVSTHGD